MTNLLRNNKLYKQRKFSNEAELEKVVISNYEIIFGKKTVYFDIKRQVESSKGNILSIPDGYLISFTDIKPKLFIIENEISTHDAYRDIAVQLLRFTASFKEGSRKVKEFLLEEIKRNKEISSKINEFIENTHFQNFSELLDFVVFDNEYSFIVIIDEATENLNFALNQLAKQPDVIEVKKFIATDDSTDMIYEFSEFFQEEIKEAITKQIRRISDIDTIVCPANEEGFRQVFINENRWYAIRIAPSIIPQIKYIAMYETAPISAIRWIGYVQDIHPYKDTGKYEIVLSKKEQISPIKLTSEESKRGGIAPQGSRYSKLELIKKAKKLSDIF